MAKQFVVNQQHLTVDLILWRQFGVGGQRMVERIHQLNPGLAALGPVLPIGTSFLIPDALPPKPQSRVVTEEPVDLFQA